MRTLLLLKPFLCLLPISTLLFLQLTLQIANLKISPAAVAAAVSAAGKEVPGTALQNPVVWVCNYSMDSLTTDLFRVEQGRLLQGCLTLLHPSHEDEQEEEGEEGGHHGHSHSHGHGSSQMPSKPLAVGQPSSSAVTKDPELLKKLTLQWGYKPVRCSSCGKECFSASSSNASGAKSAATGGAGAAPVAADAVKSEAEKQSPAPVPAAAPPSSESLCACSSSSSSPSSPFSVYGDPLLDGMLQAYADAPTLRAAGTVVFPLGALRAMSNLLQLSNGRMVLLTGDKGLQHLSELEAFREVHMAFHGSFSLQVNFHALRQWTLAHGGSCE